MVRRGTITSAILLVCLAVATAAAGQDQWSEAHYFAEGALGFFRTDIGLVNPSTTDTANVQLTYITETGERFTQSLTLAPMQRRTVSVNDALPGVAGGISTIVEADRPIAADRFMEWGSSGYGSSLSGSIDAPAHTWYFAEGAANLFSLYYLLLNPGDTPAQVTITYLQELGAPVTRTYTVSAHTRRTIVVNDDPALAHASLAAVVSSDVPIVAERSMYLSSPTETFAAGAAGLGATQLATSWTFAEGAPGGFFDEFLLIANPAPTPTTATIVYRRPDGVSATAMYDLPAQTRRTVYVNQEVTTNPDLASLVGSALSATITAPVPIVAERTMWWPRNVGGWYESSTALGATQTSTAWTVAEGRVGGPRAEQTYILIANTGASAGSVRVTVLDDAGHAATQTMPIAAFGRVTLDVGEVFGLTDTHVSALIDSLGAQPVPLVVEYSRYGSGDGQIWSAGDTTLATKRIVTQPPGVVSTSPANGATGVASDADLAVTFSEPVTVTSSAFTLACPAGSPIALTTPDSAPATTFNLHSATHLPFDTVCGLIVHATGVTGTTAPPQTMASDVMVSFTVGSCPVIAVSPASLPQATLGTAFPDTQFSQTGGHGAITWSISQGTLPAGMTLSASGLLQGTPTVPGDFTITVRATDANGCAGQRTLTVSVTCAAGAIVVNNPGVTLVNVGVPFSQSFTQTGASAPTFALNSGTVPAGLTLSANGLLSGTPTQTGTFSMTVKVTASSGCSATGPAYALTITPVAGDDVYPETVLGNVPVDSSVISYSVTASNDAVGTSTIGAYDAITVHGGSVSMTTSGPSMGQFTYNPPRGYNGPDSFTYTLTDGPLASATATVRLTVSGMAWFIRKPSTCDTACDGRLLTPYGSLAAFQADNTGIGVNPKAGDPIFIYSSDVAAPYSGALTLLNNQGLFGQDAVTATTSFTTLTGLTVPASSVPALPGIPAAGTLVNITTVPSGPGLTLDSHNNTVRGLTITTQNASDVGIFGNGSGSGTLTVSDVSVRGSGLALELHRYVASAVFRSVSSTGSASFGMYLTFITGSFSVVGDGVNLASGGTISGATQQGVLVGESENISLAFMNVESSQRTGIYTSYVNNLTLDHVQALDNGVAYGEPGFEGDGISGTATITASAFKANGASAFWLHDSGSGNTSLTFTATNCTFFNASSVPFTAGSKGDAVDLFPSGLNNVSYTFTGSSFTGAHRDLLHLEPIETTTTQITLSNNTFDGYANTSMTGSAIAIYNGNSNIYGPVSFDGTITYTIDGNQIAGTAESGIMVGLGGYMATNAGGTASGTITNNAIGRASDPTSGATTGGIYIFNDGGYLTTTKGTHSVRIQSNFVQHVWNGGLIVYAGPNGGAVTNVKVYDNTFLDFDTQTALDIRASSAGDGDVEQLCVDFGGGAHPNTITLPLFGTEDIYLWRLYDANILLPGYLGAPSDNVAVSQFIASQNNGTGGVTVPGVAGPGGFYNAASCPTP